MVAVVKLMVMLTVESVVCLQFSGTRLTVHDNHKPVFTNCSRYQPVIKEEEPLGTPVLTVSGNPMEMQASGYFCPIAH